MPGDDTGSRSRCVGDRPPPQCQVPPDRVFRAEGLNVAEETYPFRVP